MAKKKAKTKRSRDAKRASRVLLSTRKGLLFLESSKPGTWKLGKNFFEGIKVSAASQDPATRKIWVGLNHGHWGPKVHFSSDRGKTFQETAAPKYPEWTGETLKDFWCFQFHPTTTGKTRIFLGVEPAGIFYSDDQGASWTFCDGLAKVHGRDRWFAGGTDGSCVHSIMIDPADPKHWIIGISVAGVLETRDDGATWKYLSRGLNAAFLPDPASEIGQDPHCVVMSPSNPRVLWQQNHCGIYKSEDMGQNWIDLSKAKGLESAFGWAVLVDERDPDVAYTIPALSDETRVPVKKRLIVQKTQDGGKTWKPMTQGLPGKNCYDIVYRAAADLSGKELVFGSTTGSIYVSADAGKKWKDLNLKLPPIYAVKMIQ